MKCPSCAFDAPLQMHFCGKCGAYLKKVCVNCEYPNPLDYSFCGMCGTPLGDSQIEKLAEAVPAPHTSQPKSPVLHPPSGGEYSLQGERRVATIILADVKGSTDLLELLGTEAWVEIMNRVFQTLEAEIYRFGGKVDQFRGDGLVAFFGTVSAHEDDPERAILAGLKDIDPQRRCEVDSELVVEWRALTVALMDRLLPLVREKLELDASFTLPHMLQGGTWSAGRQIACALRPPDGPPPLLVAADGTVF